MTNDLAHAEEMLRAVRWSVRMGQGLIVLCVLCGAWVTWRWVAHGDQSLTTLLAIDIILPALTIKPLRREIRLRKFMQARVDELKWKKLEEGK